MRTPPSLALLTLLLWPVISGATPAQPISLNEKFVTFDGHTLSAFISLPEGEPLGASLILQGSGNVGAAGDVSGPFLGSGYQGQPAKIGEQMAETLALAGIASLRFHKRGFEDAAELPHQTMDYLQKDAEAALELLKLRFPGKKLGIVGYSEGALLALQIAAKQPVSALFLFAPPTQDFDLVLQYQFRNHPLKLLSERFDQNQDGRLSGEELTVLTVTGLPVLQVFGLTWPQLDSNQDGVLEMPTEVTAGYDGGFVQVMQLVNATMKPWYDSVKALPTFSAMAKAVSSPVYYFQGLQDAQIDASHAEKASEEFQDLRALHLFPNYGHGFSPMQGVHGEVKTSGPYQAPVIAELILDLLEAFESH